MKLSLVEFLILVELEGRVGVVGDKVLKGFERNLGTTDADCLACCLVAVLLQSSAAENITDS